MVNAYLTFSRNSEEESTRSIIQLLEKEEAKQEGLIANLRADLREKSVALTGKDPYAPSAGRPRVLQSPAGVLMEKLTNVEVEEKMAQVELEVLQQPVDADPHLVELPPTIVDHIESHPEVERLRTLILLRNSQLSDLDAKFISAANTNTYRRLQRDLEKAEGSLLEIRQQPLQN